MIKYGPITADSPFFDKDLHDQNLKEISDHHIFYIDGTPGGPFIDREGLALFWDAPIRARVEEIFETEDIQIPDFFVVKKGGQK